MAIHVANDSILVRNTARNDFDAMRALCQRVYPTSPSWESKQLESHLKVFPEGQLVAIEKSSKALVGMASSLIVRWDDYEMDAPWRDFTDSGLFTNHDPENGRTLYGAEVMVDLQKRGQGIGKMLYEGRKQIADLCKIPRIRAGARMRGYATYAKEMSPIDYLWNVVQFKIFDPTISFQLKRGFRVLAVVADYLRHDPESLGYAAIIEWLNPNFATEVEVAKQHALIKKSFGDRYGALK